jgi:hypothetical protein
MNQTASRSLFLLFATALFVTLAAAPGSAQTIRTGPSAHCHATDGSFTVCSPGVLEWSDIDFLPFAGADVYTDQSLSPANLYLLYDLLARNAPLAPTESFDIRFDVVEGGALEHYEVHAFGDGRVEVFVDGVPSPPEGIQAATGFGLSPVTGFFDVFVELKVPMNVVYSPDIPLFWSTSAPPRNCPPGDPGCHPKTLVAAVNQPVSATIVSANSDGTTTIAKVPLNATAADFCTPTGGGILGGLIDALVPPTGAYRNHGDYVRQVVHKTAQAVASLVNSQVVTAAEGEEIQSCIVSQRAQTDAGKK